MISIIIITRNEERNIARTLSVLKDPRISEIIIVDSNSTDRTVEIAKTTQDPRISITIYSKPPFTPARGRYEGGLLVDRRSKYILFLDGDMEYVTAFTDAAIAELEKDTHLAGVLGQREERCYSTDGVLVSTQENYYKGKELIVGGGLFLKSDEYFKTPGFNPNLICDEEGFLYSYFRRNGVFFKRIENKMFVHHTNVSVSKRHLLRRLSDKRLLFGLGTTLYYSIGKWFLLRSFCWRNRKPLLTGIWLALLIWMAPLWAILPFTAFLTYLFKFRIRLFVNYSILFVSIPFGFIRTLFKK